ncbi:MAG: low molecular weight phosphotyrosine protein phosphatase [Gammaproteobacteria bacterium]|nr:low molecular weight phosphotyrosine protein phosphatase [Gammaproteobacteria bacterium]
MNEKKQVNVIFVCMGNICRSPTAHGVFQTLVDEHNLSDVIGVESAGTHSYHIGNPPDLRSQSTALKNNVDLSALKARRFIRDDFDDFDYIIGMDADNIADMQSIEPESHEANVVLMLEYSTKYDQKEIPDPYFGNDGFDMVFDMIEDASTGLLNHIRSKHKL